MHILWPVVPEALLAPSGVHSTVSACTKYQQTCASASDTKSSRHITAYRLWNNKWQFEDRPVCSKTEQHAFRLGFIQTRHSVWWSRWQLARKYICTVTDYRHRYLTAVDSDRSLHGSIITTPAVQHLSTKLDYWHAGWWANKETGISIAVT